MSLLARLRLRTHDLLTDTRGSMPVEGIMASTFLIWWYVASFQFFDAYRQKNVNLKVAYDIALGGERNLTLRADIFNLFNSQSVQARNEIGEIDNGTGLTQNPDGSIDNNPYLYNPSYGLATSYQAPRYIRLGLDLEF